MSLLEDGLLRGTTWLCREGIEPVTGYPLPRSTEMTKKGQQKNTPNMIAIYEGFALMPFGGPFLETPRHEENTNTCIFLQFWTPGGAKTLENLVFDEGF